MEIITEVCIVHKNVIAPDQKRIITTEGLICADCWTFQNKLTETDRKFLLSLKIQVEHGIKNS